MSKESELLKIAQLGLSLKLVKENLKPKKKMGSLALKNIVGATLIKEQAKFFNSV